MKTLVFVATAAVCAICVSYRAFGQGASTQQMVLSVKVCEAAGKAGEPKVLAEPSLAAVAGKAFSFVSGGQLKSKTGRGDLEIGTRVAGTFDHVDAGAVQLVVQIRIGSKVSQENDPNTDLVRTEVLEIRTMLQPGKTKRLDCSDHQWCELTIDAME